MGWQGKRSAVLGVLVAVLAVASGAAAAVTTQKTPANRANVRVGKTHVTLVAGRLSGSIALRNSGGRKAAKSTVLVSYRLLQKVVRRPLKSVPSAAIGRGQRTVVDLDVAFSNKRAAGIYAIEACADARHHTRESNEDDNCKRIALLVLPATGPQGDLGPDDVGGEDDGDDGPDPDDVADDVTAPDTLIDGAPTGAVKDNPPPFFAFHATEAGSTFECRIDGGAWVTCASPYGAPVLGPGAHTFEVRATDDSGNVDASPAKASWTTIDTTPPDTIIDSGPTTPTTANTAVVSFHSSEPGSTFECDLNSQVGGPKPCQSPATFDALHNGPQTVRVWATDAAGNRDASPAVVSWVIG